MRFRLVTAALLGAAFLAAGSPASADDRPDGGGGAYVAPNGDPTATAGDGGSGGGGGGGTGGGDDDPCEWRVLVEDDFAFAVYRSDSSATQHSATGRWLQRWCPGVGAVEVDGYYLTPEGGLVDPYALAVEALASVSISPPEIKTSPSEDGRLYVQVPTWLWVEGAWWQSYEATATAGRVWSTVKATPVATTWVMGDGDTVSCRGPGTAWRPGLPEGSSGCTHTYRTSSAGEPDGRFVLQATVTLEVSWTSNATGGGTLPAISRTSTVQVDVGEIQAIGTGGGR